MVIQLSIEVKGLKTYQDGADFAHSLADHIQDTFNDDDSVNPLMYFKLYRNDGVTQIKEGKGKP